MTTARIIDGVMIAAGIRRKVADAVAGLKQRHGILPGLAVVLVGENPASQVYVRNKDRQTVEAGMRSFEHKLPATTGEAELLELIASLNRCAEVHGILVQLPLPAHIDGRKVIEAIDPAKDVDGFHPVNAGRLSIGEQSLVPCTPAGCLILAKSVRPDLKGLEAVVLGRSNIVGKPVAQLLLREDCTVTIAHSRTRDLPDVVRRADLLVAAVGRPEMVRGDWIKPGAIVIDVGINRVPVEGGKTKLVGDVAFREAVAIAGAITPVPGGVGPMTIACLLRNTVAAACTQHGLEQAQGLDMTEEAQSLGYRPCVGIMVINRDGKVWVGLRADMPNEPEGPGEWWQMPQGGIDAGEDPRTAALRELREETGIRSVEVIGETSCWLTYDLPTELQGKAWGGRWRGQKQKWYAVRFLGSDDEVDITPPPGHNPEFSRWKWTPVTDLVSTVVPFKREVYRAVVAELAPLARPLDRSGS